MKKINNTPIKQTHIHTHTAHTYKKKKNTHRNSGPKKKQQQKHQQQQCRRLHLQP